MLIHTVFRINSMFIRFLGGVECLTLWSEFCIYLLQLLWDACKSHSRYRRHESLSLSRVTLLGSVCFTLLQQIIYAWILIHFLKMQTSTPEMYIKGTPLCQEQFKIFPTCHIQNIFILYTNYIRWYQHLKLIWWMVIFTLLWQHEKYFSVTK